MTAEMVGKRFFFFMHEIVEYLGHGIVHPVAVIFFSKSAFSVQKDTSQPPTGVKS